MAKVMWALRRLQPHLTSQAYVEALRRCRKDPSLTWLELRWFFPDEVKTSLEEIEKAINQIKIEVKRKRKSKVLEEVVR